MLFNKTNISCGMTFFFSIFMVNNNLTRKPYQIGKLNDFALNVNS